MKKLAILLIFLVGCSKDEVKPSMSGRWTFSTTRFSADFTIQYPKVLAGGKFIIDGTTYTTEDRSFPELVNGETTVELIQMVPPNSANSLRFVVQPSADFSKLNATNLNYRLAPGFDISVPDKFTITRK